jgi:two-component system, response regulator YesN
MKGTSEMKKIMIVDDDKSVIKGLSDHVSWEKLNIEVMDTASNGEEALAKVRQQQPDILVTDIYMPKMNGLELIKTIHKEFPSIYIIIHSGYNHFDNAREAIRYGVKHFFLKPSTVQEIESVFSEIIQEIEAEEKQKTLLSSYTSQLKEYLSYTKDALIRELLVTGYSSNKIPLEKLELLDLKKDTSIMVASLSLIRPPYLTASKEREWQLMKLSSGNIIKEILENEKELHALVDIHLVDYTDTTYVLVFIAKDYSVEINKLCFDLAKKLIENLLTYLKLSSNVGIGGMKAGIHEINNSYLESLRALEAAEYQEMNKVFTFEEVHGREESEPYHYPFELLKEIHYAIHQKEYEHLLEVWDKYEQQVMMERTPLYMVQNICFSIINVLMISYQSDDPLKQNTLTMTEIVTKIYAQPSIHDLTNWMREKLQEGQGQMKEELSGKKSHKLISGVQDYVQNYYDQEITLAEIAESLYVNRNYLSQLYKKVTGETFVTYLNKFRIEKAKQLLREQQYMVYEVSEMVGYQNPTYFSQVFKSITGVSPSEYYK